MTADTLDRWLPGPQAAIAAQRAEATLRTWVRRGQVRCRKVRNDAGKLVNLYHEGDLLRCERDRRVRPTGRLP
jgi:hypothetical protein